jgi:hypothetical protein
MQIINLKLDHYNFYCPVSGEYITTEEDGVNENALSFRGYWFDEFWYKPTIKDERLSRLWSEYFQGFKRSSSDYIDLDFSEKLDEFFSSVNLENYVVFKIHKNEISAIPDKLMYYVIDMNAG